jgi:hypothetical protein
MSLTVSPSWPLEPYDTYQQHLPTETKASFGSKRGQALGSRFPTGKSLRPSYPSRAGGERSASTLACLEIPGREDRQGAIHIPSSNENILQFGT